MLLFQELRIFKVPSLGFLYLHCLAVWLFRAGPIAAVVTRDQCGAVYNHLLGHIAQTPTVSGASNCHWTLQGPPGSVLLLEFHKLYGSPEANLQISDSESVLKIEMWNSTSPQPAIVSKSNIVHVNVSARYGFRLSWKVFNSPVLHKTSATWVDARRECQQLDGNLIPDEDYFNNFEDTIFNSIADKAIQEVWFGKYSTLWTRLIGCFELHDVPYHVVRLRDNRIQACLNKCSSYTYIALREEMCYCLDDFDGDNVNWYLCSTPCAGNNNEKCGGVGKYFTLYMKGSCFQNSTEWRGKVSMTQTFKKCLNWSPDDLNTSSNSLNITFEMGGNSCRDPDNSGYVWCYVDGMNGTRIKERCDVFKCPEDSISDEVLDVCLGVTKDTDGAMVTKQLNCNGSHIQTMCITEDGNFTLEGNLTHFLHECFTMGGILSSDVSEEGGVSWTGHFRQPMLVSELDPDYEPEDCYKLVKTPAKLQSKPAKCSDDLPFMCNTAVVTCGCRFNSTSGSLEAISYTSNEFCVWIIEFKEKMDIKLILLFHIEYSPECKNDYIKVFEGEGTTKTKIDTKCGTAQDTLDLTASVITIHYNTDMKFTDIGFTATWDATPSNKTHVNEPISIKKAEKTKLIVFVTGLVVVVVLSVVMLFLERRRTTVSKKQGKPLERGSVTDSDSSLYDRISEFKNPTAPLKPPDLTHTSAVNQTEKVDNSFDTSRSPNGKENILSTPCHSSHLRSEMTGASVTRGTVQSQVLDDSLTFPKDTYCANSKQDEGYTTIQDRPRNTCSQNENDTPGESLQEGYLEDIEATIPKTVVQPDIECDTESVGNYVAVITLSREHTSQKNVTKNNGEAISDKINQQDDEFEELKFLEINFLQSIDEGLFSTNTAEGSDGYLSMTDSARHSDEAKTVDGWSSFSESSVTELHYYSQSPDITAEETRSEFFSNIDSQVLPSTAQFNWACDEGTKDSKSVPSTEYLVSNSVRSEGANDRQSVSRTEHLVSNSICNVVEKDSQLVPSTEQLASDSICNGGANGSLSVPSTEHLVSVSICNESANDSHSVPRMEHLVSDSICDEGANDPQSVFSDSICNEGANDSQSVPSIEHLMTEFICNEGINDPQ